jgi:transposase InsO family protein
MTKDEHLRLVTFRSKFLEHAKRIGNVSATCRYFGISREKFYKWKKRFDELGAAGLGDRPRRPHHSPNETPRAVVSKVLYLRQNYHFGAGRIRDYLKRFHSIRIAGQTVQNILRKHGLGRLPANQKHQPHGKRWKRYEKAQPGHRLQMDVKFLERIPGTKKRLYQFTAIDDCTRIRVLKIYDACNQTASVDFANEVVRRLPFRVHVVQTDNGSEFGSHFHWHLERLDIRHVRIRPRTPRLNGKVERSHRIDKRRVLSIARQGGASVTTSTSPTRRSASGRTTTTTTVRTARSAA